MATAPTFVEYARAFEKEVLPMKKPATVATMQSHLRFFCQPDVFGSLTISQIDRSTVQSAFVQMRTNFELSPKTLRNRWGTLHLVLEQARQDGLLSTIPLLKLPRNERKPQPFFTIAQMREIIFCAPEPYATFSAVLAETGARIGEVVAIQDGNLDLDNGLLGINCDVYRGRIDSTKTNSANRTLCLSSFLVERLRSHIVRFPRKSPFLFQTRTGTPFWPHEAQKPLAQVMRDRKITPAGYHAWRRGNITYAGTVLGMPEPLLAERVGHRSPTITFGIYTQSMPGYDRPWAEKIGASLFAEAL